MNKTLGDYIKSCNMDELLNLFEMIIDELNKRKEQKESEDMA